MFSHLQTQYLFIAFCDIWLLPLVQKHFTPISYAAVLRMFLGLSTLIVDFKSPPTVAKNHNQKNIF
jgi:hypothetical protein